MAKRIREEIREAVRITDDLVARHGLPFPEFGLFDPNSASDDAADRSIRQSRHRHGRAIYPLLVDLQADIVGVRAELSHH